MIFRYDNERDKIYFTHTPDSDDMAALTKHFNAIKEECGVPGKYDRWESFFRELTKDNSNIDNPIMFYDDAESRTFKFNLFPEYDAAGKVVSIICISQDITEMMNIIDTVCVLKKEKETMLRELHDRVKNNLQIVESLLRLQADRIHDFNYYTLYENYLSRIHSMALIQNRMYQEDNIEVVKMGSYINDFIETVQKSNDLASKNIHFTCTSDTDKLDIASAIPCALILNELVSNSLQHAFPDGREGRISIRFSSDVPDTDHVLFVSDDGIGIPEHVDCYNPSTLGLELVHSLVQQLKGSITISRKNGTHYSIKF